MAPILHTAGGVSMRRHMSPERYVLEGGWLAGKEKRPDCLAQSGQRIGRVDGGPEVRSVVEALGVPRRQSAHLVDDPSVVGEGTGFVDSFVPQQIDVVQEEAPAIFERDRPSRAARDEIRCLSKNPGIAQDA